MNNIEKLLEFNKIKEDWIKFVYTNEVKEKIKEIKPYISEIELISKQRETTESRLLLEKVGNPPLVSLAGIDEYINNAQMGMHITTQEFIEIEKALVAVKRLKNYLNLCKNYNTSIPYYADNLDYLEELNEEIHSKIRNNKVDDNASKILKNIRMQIKKIDAQIKEKVDIIIRSKKEYMSDNFSTFRNGRVCIPVKKEYKHKISGNIIDKSSTGHTLFIEPSAINKYYEKLQILHLDEENEERRILYILTDMLLQNEEVLIENIRIIKTLDFIFSKGKLSIYYDAIQPKINTNRKIVLKRARNPLLNKDICIPIDFKIGE